MKYEGYFIEQHDNGSWEAWENIGSGFEAVIEHQKTAQDCIEYINDFLL
ncbi:hypothetical protein [Shewanella baltica]|nr:hypothetical protein [Shewanella baltica]MCS6204024.1 hypothetical protein [Shewanella baltica]